jgi:CheY-like chemotaxis protein
MAEGKYVLMVEDDPDDQFLTKDVLKELNSDIPFEFLSDSTQVFHFLETASALPALIILDKNLPAIDGLQILKELKAHSIFKTIPVTVISGSAFPEEIAEFYKQGAASFVIKPSTGKLTHEKIASFLHYWLNVCELPLNVQIPANKA